MNRQQSIQRMLYLLTSVLVIISLGCNVPAPATPTAAPTLQPTPKPLSNLPPTLVEVTPLPSSDISPNTPITFTFSQAMDRASVEAAIQGDPKLSGSFTWLSDETVRFTPLSLLPLNADVRVKVAATAKGKNGLALIKPFEIPYRTSGGLLPVTTLPAPDAVEVDPSSALVVAFNRPVVPLVAEAVDLPAAFTVNPAVEGRGEWLNTSTYIFYPEPSLLGGAGYTITLNPDLTTTDGIGYAEEATDMMNWSFQTALPAIVSVSPQMMEDILLDQEFSVGFNQIMDVESVRANVRLKGPDGSPVALVMEVKDDGRTFTFTPEALLARNSLYTLEIPPGIHSLGGAQLQNESFMVYYTVPALGIRSSNPEDGGVMDFDYYWRSVSITFTAPLAAQDVQSLISFEPALEDLTVWAWKDSPQITIQGDFQPRTSYTLRISQSLQDTWGGRLSEPAILRFTTGAPPPAVTIPYYYYSGKGVFVTPTDAKVSGMVTNISYVNMASARLSLEDYIFVSEMWENEKYDPPGGMTTWTQSLSVPPDKNEAVNFNLSPSGDDLAPGLYYIRMSAPQVTQQWMQKQWAFLTVVSQTHLTLKKTGSDLVVWAVNLQTGQPVEGETVTAYDNFGNTLAQSVTGADGIAALQWENMEEYNGAYVTLGTPGSASFSLASTRWNDGINLYDLGVGFDDPTQKPLFYIYTDRAIYRPGQPVYYRVVVRDQFNGRYSLGEYSNVEYMIFAPWSEERSQEVILDSGTLSLSPYGTAYGMLNLSENADPGEYRIRFGIDGYVEYFTFRVEEYRKPEIDLQVSFSAGNAVVGSDLQASVDAKYFFGAPAGDVDLTWRLYADPSYFYLPGYQTGVLDTSWFYPASYSYRGYSGAFGDEILSGEASTALDGKVTIAIPWDAIADRLKTDTLTRLTLEVTVSDTDELPVSNRAQLNLHPAEFYIGVNPEQWGGQAGAELGFGILSAGWDKNPVPGKGLTAKFEKMTWVPAGFDPYSGMQQYDIVYSPVATTDFRTGGDGKARLAFTPPTAGTYRLEVSGGGAVTQVLVWIGGSGAPAWPDMPNNRIRLTRNAESYRPGDTATIFIPNPFVGTAQALVTVERGLVMRSEVVAINGASLEYSLPLGEDDAPNVYFSVLLLGKDANGMNSFRLGIVNLPVDRSALTLNVSLTPEPIQTTPGGTVTYTLRVTDQQGKPVEGEFSLALVDKAVLALADPNSLPITDYFYGNQSLGVRTSLSLAVAGYRTVTPQQETGRGGGGAEAARQMFFASIEVRENFRDTAFWSGAVQTNANGEATITVQLPDNLTTWVATVRGITKTSLVGETTGELVVSKPLLVRPQTPRFLVQGDYVQLAAIVHNNTSQDMTVEVNLQAAGVTLDESITATQTIDLRAGENYRVTWWVTAGDADEADLVFAAQGGGYQDAARPEWGRLPILKYSSPQTFGTVGLLAEPGEQLEIVALPRSYTPTGGKLTVELSPSLAGAILAGLDALEEFPYELTEGVLSRLLPNLETYRALNELGIDAPELKSRLETLIRDAIEKLERAQNADGGWGWDAGMQSDELISTYVLFGLARAVKADIAVDGAVLENGAIYVIRQLDIPTLTSANGELNRLAFQYYALEEAGYGSTFTDNLYPYRNRLDPWAKAFLALTLEQRNPGNLQSQTLISDLASSAVRSATGAHWEAPAQDYFNLATGNYNTAVVLLALAQFEPASPLLTDATRYLVNHRNAGGCWNTTYESTWVIMALTNVLKATGDLQADYAFSATLNDNAIASGEARGLNNLNSVTAEVPLGQLTGEPANALRIIHDQGIGRLYYRAFLQVFRPVETAAPVNKGITVSRSYYLAGQDCSQEECPPITSLSLGSRGQLVTARVTLTLPREAYYLVVEDYLPAGMEVLNTRLKTSQLGEGETSSFFDPLDPFRGGWGWWWFSSPKVYDERIRWVVTYLPAGTYELTYTLVPMQPGEFRVLPAHAYQHFFPEVEGASAGMIFRIEE